jgi:hypothetical protein
VLQLKLFASIAKKLGALCGKKRKDLTAEDTKRIYAKFSKKQLKNYAVNQI